MIKAMRLPKSYRTDLQKEKTLALKIRGFSQKSKRGKKRTRSGVGCKYIKEAATKL